MSARETPSRPVLKDTEGDKSLIIRGSPAAFVSNDCLTKGSNKFLGCAGAAANRGLDSADVEHGAALISRLGNAVGVEDKRIAMPQVDRRLTKRLVNMNPERVAPDAIEELHRRRRRF